MPDATLSEKQSPVTILSRKTFVCALALSLILPLGLFFLFVMPEGEATNDTVSTTGSGSSRGIDNVFVVVIDGLRASEGFEDPTHQYIPNIWNNLRPLGTIYTNFINSTHTSTTSAHAAITSGAVQFIPNTMQKIYGDIARIQEDPSIFQYYRYQLGIPKDKTWIINGKGPFIKYSGISRNPFFKDLAGPQVALNTILEDDKTWKVFEGVVDKFRPSLTLVNFAHVDSAGHSGNWQLYTDAIRHADHYVYQLCRKIFLDPHYSNNTAIFITSDHGRHLQGIKTEFQDHGCSCRGCRKVPLLVIGPGIKKNHVVTREGRLIDIIPTVAEMLGVDVRFRNGRVLNETFDVPPPVEPYSLTRPCTASANGVVHLGTMKTEDGYSSIQYTRSLDNGVTWSTPVTLSTEPQNMFPSIAARGNRVALAWTCTMQDGEIRSALCESSDGGMIWTGPVYFPGDDPLRPDLYPDVCYFNNLLSMVWAEPYQGESALNIVRFDNGVYTGKGTMNWPLLLNPRCVATGAGAHVVFQKLNLASKNWEVAYVRHNGAQWLPTVFLSSSAGESIDPDIVVDAAGFHAVWAEEINGIYRIIARNSLDGVTWDAPKLVGSSKFGAWRPRIESTLKGLIVVWEGYENEHPIIFAAASQNGGQSWTRSFKLSVSNSDDVYPAHTVDANSYLHVFWEKGPWPATIGKARFKL